MDVERFARELPELFEDYPRSATPRGLRFDDLLEGVPGLARENNLALLNLAASLLEPGESYVEVGTYRGLSLIAAAGGNEGDFVGIDDFSFRDGSRAEVDGALERFGVRGASLLEGDAFELLRNGALGDRRVGVYYYDADHSYQAQLEGLVLVEPYLADRALVVVDDTDWEDVARATAAYLERQPRARLLAHLQGSGHGFPQWWEGMQVLAWEP